MAGNPKAVLVGKPSGKVPKEAVRAARAPNSGDKNYAVGQEWVDYVNFDIYFLAGFSSGAPQWINAGGGSGTFTNLTASGTVTFSALGLGAVLSSATGVLSSVNGTNGQLLIAGTGVAPAWASLTSGDGSVTITPGSNTLDIQVSGAAASSFPTDSGTATPAAGATNIFGGTNVNTAGAGSTVTINVDNNPTFTGLITGNNGLTITAGSTSITSDTDAAGAITLDANAGSSETILIRSQQGTSATSLNLTSTSGGITLDAGLGSADAINFNASNAAGGIDIDSGTGGIIADTTGAISLDGAAASNFTLTGAFDLTLSTTAGSVIIDGGEAAGDAIQIDASNGAGGMQLTSGTGGIDLLSTNGTVNIESGTAAINVGADAAAHTVTVGSTTGAASTVIQTGTGAMTFTAGGVFDVNGVGNVTIDSTGGTLNMGSGADANDINIGTGGAARTITIGNSTGATALSFTSGSGAVTYTAGGAFDVNATGNVTIDSTGGTLGIGEDADAQNINIGTGAAARTITMGNGTGGTSVVLDCGTGAFNLGQNATDHTTTIGSTTGTSAFTAQAGSGAMTFTAGGAFDVNGVGNVTIDSTGGTLGIGEGADANNINIGTGGAARTITVGNTTGATAVNIDSGTGGITLDSNSTGDIHLTPGTNAAAGTTITLNAKVGVVTLTGNTTASGAQEAFTITNSEVSATSGILVTVANVGGNDARMTLEQVKPAAGSFVVNTQNNGAAALNGDVIISFVVLN